MFLAKTPLGRKYQNIVRYKQIISVLIRHGFYDFVENTNLSNKINLKNKYIIPENEKASNPEGITHWARIRLVLEDLGPTFIKLGQFVSNRPDLIPDELCEELMKLLDHVPPFDNSEAIDIMERELDGTIDELFQDFEREPTSSASIAQVHKATLKDGTPVAVKIQRPGIKKIIDADLEVMRNLAELIKKHVKGADIIDPVVILDEFKDGIHEEIDFNNEANNIHKFETLYANEPHIVVPKIYRDLTTEHVIIMGYISGYRLSELDPEAAPEDINYKAVTKNMANLVLNQIFEAGFFHADPHAGNIILCENNSICFIDFGLMGLLPPKHKAILSEMIFGLVDDNPTQIMRAVLRLSLNKEVESRDRLENQIYKIVEGYVHLPLEEINISHFLRDLINTIVKNRVILPPNIYILLKSLISLEGTVRKYDPRFNMLEHIEPFARKLMFENSGPKKFIKDIYLSGFDYIKLLCDLPTEIRDIFALIKNKTLKMQFEIKGLEPALNRSDAINNRLCFAIITAAMLTSSALIIHAKVGPKIGDLSILGLMGFILSFLMGTLLIISIIRHNKM